MTLLGDRKEPRTQPFPTRLEEGVHRSIVGLPDLTNAEDGDQVALIFIPQGQKCRVLSTKIVGSVVHLTYEIRDNDHEFENPEPE